MRALIQRVSKAEVQIDKNEIRSIGQGYLIFLGIENDDTQVDINWLSAKISKLRLFDDQNEVMNKSVLDINGDIMIISQFTLYAKTKKGNRPSYIHAAKPDIAIPLYEDFKKQITHELGKEIISGEFGAHMDVTLTNNGPVTIWIDTKDKE